jgi:hypothetical protein
MAQIVEHSFRALLSRNGKDILFVEGHGRANFRGIQAHHINELRILIAERPG